MLLGENMRYLLLLPCVVAPTTPLDNTIEPELLCFASWVRDLLQQLRPANPDALAMPLMLLVDAALLPLVQGDPKVARAARLGRKLELALRRRTSRRSTQ